MGIGSTRALIGMMAVLLVGGPVRFMGHFIAFLFCVCVLLHLTFEVSCFSTQASLLGKWKSLQRSWFRLVFPVLLAAVAWAVTHGGHLAVPTTVGELQGIGTFLPVPPQYVAGVNEKQRIGELGVADDAVLVEVDGIRSFYIAVIFGIMHGNLLVLCLLPLPVCYALQAELVAFSPRLRCFVPKDPVWLHRTLGYILIFGLAFTAVWWVAFQGFGCFVLEAGAAPSPEVRSSRKSVRWVFAYAGPKICAVGSGMKPPGRPFLCPWNSIVRRQVGRGSKMPSKKGSSCSCTELLATAILGRGCAVGSRSGALIFACRRQCRMKHEIHAQRVCPPAASLHQFSVVVP